MRAFNVTQQRTLANMLMVADSFLRSLVGLMGRPGLDAGHGLWIVPCQSVHTFWMRFPIDVIFLDEHRKVIHLAENLRPFRISRHLPNARSVIELPVSSIKATGTQIGDEIWIAEK
jgi:uncharacterized protein